MMTLPLQAQDLTFGLTALTTARLDNYYGKSTCKIVKEMSKSFFSEAKCGLFQRIFLNTVSNLGWILGEAMITKQSATLYDRVGDQFVRKDSTEICKDVAKRAYKNGMKLILLETFARGAIGAYKRMNHEHTYYLDPALKDAFSQEILKVRDIAEEFLKDSSFID